MASFRSPLAVLILASTLAACSGPTVRSSFSRRIALKKDCRLGIVSNDLLADAIGTELLNYGFTVVERSRIAAVFDELKLNASGGLSPDKIKSLGKVLSVDALVFTTMNPEPAHPNAVALASVKIVDA